MILMRCDDDIKISYQITSVFSSLCLGVAESQPGDSRDPRNPPVVRMSNLQQALFILVGTLTVFMWTIPPPCRVMQQLRLQRQLRNALVWICVYGNIVLMYSKEVIIRGSTFQSLAIGITYTSVLDYYIFLNVSKTVHK